MAQQLDYGQMSRDIVRLVGGPENVQSLGHCMTRLRFILKDAGKADQDAIKKIKGVVGVVYAGGQFMVILGKNLLPVYEAAQKEFHFDAGEASTENAAKEKQPLTLKSAGNAVLGYVSASVMKLVPGLVAGGMLKVALLLITLAAPEFSATQTYTLLSGLADAPFYFMPIFIAYGAASKLGATPVYSMICAAALLHGNYTALVAAGDPVSLMGIPVRLVSYSSSLLPALLIALVAYYAEKGFNKIVPGIFKSIFVGLGTIVVTMTLGYTVLGPLGSYAGSYISQIFVFLGNYVSPVAIGLLAASLPWLVMCGMHAALAPFMAMAITDPGYDPVFRPAFILHNMAEGGACIGVGLRTRNPELRSEAWGIAFGCITAGVTEPAVYGINLPRKKPMIGVMAGGAVGGIIAGVFGVRAYEMGYSTLLALPIFKETFIGMAVSIVATVLVATVVTFFLGFDEEQENSSSETMKTEASVPNVSSGPSVVAATAKGTVVPMEKIPDAVFSEGILGQCCGIDPTEGKVYGPVDGVIANVAETLHAINIESGGLEILIHVGIDTVDMNGDGFSCLVKEGDLIKKGQLLLTMDLKKIKAAGHPATVITAVTNSDDLAGVELTASGIAEPGMELLRIQP